MHEIIKNNIVLKEVFCYLRDAYVLSKDISIMQRPCSSCGYNFKIFFTNNIKFKLKKEIIVMMFYNVIKLFLHLTKKI